MFQKGTFGRFEKTGTCLVLEGDLFDLLDGKVAHDRCALLVSHLGECEGCAALHGALVHTDALLREFCEENE